MEFLKVYDKICSVLQKYTQVNDANMFRINDPTDIGIKKNNELIVFIKLGTLNHKVIPQKEVADLKLKYPHLSIYSLTDGNNFMFYDYDDNKNGIHGFDSMMNILADKIVRLQVDVLSEIKDDKILSLDYLSNYTGIESYNYNGKKIFVFDDHRTTLAILFEAYRLGVFEGKAPNLITFDYHEDCCKVKSKSELLKKIGVSSLLKANSRQFWSFVEFDLSKVDDDWIAAAQELNLIKDVVIIGNEANSNVDNNAIIKDEDGNDHRIYSIPHLSSSLGNRGCLGDSFIKEPYYRDIRDCLGCHNDLFNPSYPFVLDFDLDCFSTDCRGYTIAWPELMFINEFEKNEKVNYFLKEMVEKASFITISREPGCCGGLGESNRILQYLDRYFFDGNLKTFKIR